MKFAVCVQSIFCYYFIEKILNNNILIGKTMVIRELRDSEFFNALDEDEVSSLIVGEIVELKSGDILFSEGDEARHFFIILDGTLEIYRNIKGQKLIINSYSEGMSCGEVSLMSGNHHLANAMTLTDSKVFRINENDFWCMMGNSKTFRKKVLANMGKRYRDLNRLSFQREQLVSLGTMAAGLAHELNNPAAAAKSTANDISRTLQEFNLNSSEILKRYLFKDHVNIDGYPFQPIKDIINIGGVKLNPLQKSELEDQLADWLEEIGINNPWDLAPILVSVGFTKESLKNFSGLLVPNQVINFIKWLSKDLEMRMLSYELVESTNRISDLITAMKSYSFMDQSIEKSKTDLHKGIDDTLIILNHRIKQKRISIERQYEEDFPKITACGSELNQVWTNLIHNAIDAVANEGEITIKTYRNENGNTITVEIIDNGVGIPEDIQHKVFDPFFTTKAPGEGTGLGLDISQRIIVKHHNGSIGLSSKPGLTIFRVCLPIE